MNENPFFPCGLSDIDNFVEILCPNCNDPIAITEDLDQCPLCGVPINLYVEED